MRVANPRLLRLATLMKGAIVEEGDGELILSPYTEISSQVQSPINRVFGTAQAFPTLIDDTFAKSDVLNGAGVAALATTDFATMSKGVWSFEISVAFAFTGTSDVGKSSGLSLIDPDANAYAVPEFAHINGVDHAMFQVLHLALQRDGFFFRLTRGATIAGDFVSIAGAVNGRRLL